MYNVSTQTQTSPSHSAYMRMWVRQLKFKLIYSVSLCPEKGPDEIKIFCAFQKQGHLSLPETEMALINVLMILFV